MRRRLTVLVLVALLGVQGCGGDGGDGPERAPVEGGKAEKAEPDDPLTDPASWQVADPVVAEGATAAYGKAAVEQAVALATHVTQTGSYRTDLLPSQPRRPDEFTFLDESMTETCRKDLRRLVKKALAPGADQADFDGLSAFAFWSLGNDTWHLRSELKPRAEHQRIVSTRVAPADEGVLAVTQRVAADLHFTIEGRPRLVALGKQITWFIADTDGPDQGEWGTWRLDGWKGRIAYGEPRPDPAS
jgi:hypothetical protein